MFAGLAARVIVMMIVLLAILMAWAWFDGGREAVRPISVPVPVPGAVR